tara:strand:+ start:268 stop:495 length:228 start_codon:yes stop_codon:yes gene_type:complete
MELTFLVGILAIVAQTDVVREYKEHSNNLNKYQIVSVECDGGLNDSGYSIPIKQKVYLKELGKGGKLGIICQNRK